MYSIDMLYKLRKFVKSARWLRPSESSEDQDCAVMEFDLEFSPDAVKMTGFVTFILRLLDSRVDTDHPLFHYLGQQQEKNEASKLTMTVLVRPKNE